MRTLHITPGPSAGGSLLRAIRESGHDGEVLPFPDDLSCGPIKTDDPSARTAWWGEFYDTADFETSLGRFWDRVTATDDRIVVWFGRHAASELAFFLAWTDRLGERPYHVVDVTGLRLPFRGLDGATSLSRPVQSVAVVQPDALKTLFGTALPITVKQRDEGKQHWQRLKSEDAPFRVVTEVGLVSAASNHFDPLLLAQATQEWQKVGRIVGNTMGYNAEPYFQVSDLMLRSRVQTLVNEGRMLADGDPWDWSCRIKLSE